MSPEFVPRKTNYLPQTWVVELVQARRLTGTTKNRRLFSVTGESVSRMVPRYQPLCRDFSAVLGFKSPFAS